MQLGLNQGCVIISSLGWFHWASIHEQVCLFTELMSLWPEKMSLRELQKDLSIMCLCAPSFGKPSTNQGISAERMHAEGYHQVQCTVAERTGADQ